MEHILASVQSRLTETAMLTHNREDEVKFIKALAAELVKNGATVTAKGGTLSFKKGAFDATVDTLAKLGWKPVKHEQAQRMLAREEKGAAFLSRKNAWFLLVSPRGLVELLGRDLVSTAGIIKQWTKIFKTDPKASDGSEFKQDLMAEYVVKADGVELESMLKAAARAVGVTGLKIGKKLATGVNSHGSEFTIEIQTKGEDTKLTLTLG